MFNLKKRAIIYEITYGIISFVDSFMGHLWNHL